MTFSFFRAIIILVIVVEKAIYEKLDKSVSSCSVFVYEMDIKLKKVVSSLESIVKSNDIGNEEDFNMELMLKNNSVWKNFTEEVNIKFNDYMSKISKQADRVSRAELTNFKALGIDEARMLKNYTDEQIAIVESIHSLIIKYGEYIFSLEKEYKNNLDVEWLTRAKNSFQDAIFAINTFYNGEYVKVIKVANKEACKRVESGKR